MDGVIIYFAGSPWDSVAGTDKNLATSLGKSLKVLWVDPPQSIHRLWKGESAVQISTLLTDLGNGVTRLRTFGPPGVTRPGVRRGTEWACHQYVRAAVRALGWPVIGTICASPTMSFPQRLEGTKLLFVTDDWLSGAELMGISEGYVKRILRKNAGQATVVAAVSDHLAGMLEDLLGRHVALLPNGCVTSVRTDAVNPGFAKAALIGHLNDRLDFEILDAVANTGIHIAVAGPKAPKSSLTESRLESFLARPNVHWHGVLSPEGIAKLLAGSNVGLTPYADTKFNRSSFPLKTLDYVAAGVPVVATDLPASRFDPDARVMVAATPEGFAQAVKEASAKWPTEAERDDQAKVAEAYTWDKGAERVRKLLSVNREKNRRVLT